MSLAEKFRLHLLCTACCLAALPITAGAAHAQSGVESVTVTGEQYAVEKSINNKRQLNVVSDGISAD
jgi:hypothetical protein